MSARLAVEGLHKSFGRIVGVESLSHHFAPGKITAIVGPSGSGKSTALAMIAGLSRPDRGHVYCDGVDITDLAPERRNFGVVFQSYALFPNLTVRGNVEFGLRVRGVDKGLRRQRGDEAMQRVRIARLAERRVEQLSGGEQQRVALARALAFDPQVLMLDEPLSALDAQLREELRIELRTLLDSLALTTIYVTHDQTEAMALSDELVVMNAGRIEQHGRPEDVYRQPANRFVAGFLGSANLVEGICTQGPGGRRVVLPFAELEVAEGAALGPCWVLLRPQDLGIVELGSGHFQAEVERATFLGDRMRLELRAEAISLIADVPPPAPVGKLVGIRVRTPHLRVLAKQEELR